MGKPGLGAMGGTGGMSYGAPDLIPVHVGSGGGGGGTASGGQGGNGGGAVVLLGKMVTVAGKVDVSGLDGFPATAVMSGGGGGGSAGSILISGDTVVLEAGHQLTAIGGHGGAGAAGGSNGGDGSDGRIVVTGNLAVTGSLNATPMAQQGASALTAFPR
jgi:hypothetical protein